ncbi:ATP-binding protein [Kitasatospora sp. DSM 101779]|uniref:ATP-binding protein n=1 Tax=Kitasatospora sp. DSM 101779 TaxID=2853165 RepID=UPI0021D9D9B7|nr:ATP-binding protein [Kitasatospora sp. DSM 101779]MCU7824703.1 ATP-binding protein [Kitasatospora sp. DSM 101779]
MGLDGTRGQQAPQAQRTSAVPPQRTLPFDLAAWATEPRPAAAPGIFRLGHRPHDETRAEQAAVPARPLLLRAALNLAVGTVVYLQGVPLIQSLLTAVGLTIPSSFVVSFLIALAVNVAVLIGVFMIFGSMGRWAEVWRRWVAPALSRTVTHEEPAADAEAPLTTDPWAELRAAAPQAAGRLDGEPVGDVDYARIRHAWETVLADPELLPAFAEQVEVRGAAACAHPSEARDLPGRSGRHDLLTRQVRLGTAQNVVKNPPAHRSAGFALDPQLLGTSLLAVGPAGTGKTARLARPVAEALCLQALAGAACAVVIGAAESDLGPDAWYDVVIAPGDPGSPYGLDLYGAATDTDEAAARLADALLPDELAARAETARTALQQVVGPYHAAYGRYPGVRELRALLGGDQDAWAVLRKALHAAGRLAVHEADLQHRESRHGRVDDPGTLLADRLALLDRPVFARSFAGGPDALPPFAMRALEHPLRVRVKLPERSHPEVARMLSRLVVAQFVQAASARTERSLFAGLVVDDASAAVDAQIVRGLQRMRAANAGAVLLLRTLVDLPEPLRAPLFGAVGCRMAFPGIAPWDGRLFSEAWGTHLVTETAVTHTPDTSGGLVRKAARAGRKALSGTTAQTESVTTRDVERHRWSPSDLAHALPSGHAVVSLTTVDGDQVPPLLVDLRD